MVPASANRFSGWPAVVRFGLWTLLISGLASGCLLPWLASWNLSWWQVFRRCVSLSAALSLWICVRQEGHTPRTYGFSGWAEAGKRELLTGLVVGAACLMLLFGIGLLVGFYHVDVTPERAKLWRTLLGFIPGAVLVAVLEEFVFRGFLLQQLMVPSKAMGIAVSSALYSVVHLRTPLAELTTWMELGGLFLLGVVLALSYLQSRRLFLAVGLHASLAYGARVNKLLIAHPHPDLAWLIGTGRLVNGLIGWTALLALGGWIAWRGWCAHKGGATDGVSSVGRHCRRGRGRGNDCVG